MTGKDNEKPLHTQLMQEKSKGDSFPESWDKFSDDDIRAFFDELFEKTGQRKSDIIHKADIARTYGYQIMEGRRLGKRDDYLIRKHTFGYIK